LYRHFPTRLDLIEAVLTDQVAALVESGRGLLDADDAFAALAAWLRATLAHGLGYRGLSAAVLNSALDHDLVARWHAVRAAATHSAAIEPTAAPGGAVARARGSWVRRLLRRS
jgi:AcrR family transcriptional regulator